MSKRVFKILSSIVFSAIIILALGGYFAVKHFDLNKYKIYAEEWAQKELGRELRIKGDAKVALSLIPTVVINDIEFANASWAQNPQMVTIKQAEVKFSLLPLLNKQIVIDKIALIEPDVYLEKSDVGAVNWELGKVKKIASTGKSVSVVKVAAAAPAAAVMSGFAAKNMEIISGKVEYYDAQTNKIAILNIDELSMKVPSYDEPITMNADMAYNQQKISMQANLGSLAQLLSNNDNFPFLINISALGVKADVNGGIVNVSDSPQYALETNIYNPAGNLNMPEITLSSRIDGDLKGLNMKINSMNIVDNNITGMMNVRWDSKVPQISADLKSPKINVQQFNTNNNFANVSLGLINEAKALEFVPNKEVPYALLSSLDANINLNIGNLILAQGLEANNVSANVILKNGRLSVKPLELDFGGGNIVATILVDSVSHSMSIIANSKNMLLQNLYKEFAISGDGDFGIKSGGNLDLDVSLSSEGNTYRELSENLKGQVIAIAGKSVLQTGGLQFLKQGLISQLLSLLNLQNHKEKDLNLNCAVMRADFGNGKAIFPNGIAVDSDLLMLISDGSINLINDKLSFTIEPSLNKLASGNIAQALASFIRLSGTLQNPQLKLDDTEALKTIVGVVATGGANYLGSQMLLAGNGTPCYKALEGTKYANKFPKPTGVRAETQEIYQDTTKQIKDGLQGLQNTAKDLLKMFK
ncbi:MAG: AsmA family protein [Alphaproteobacteria bacterium]|nr:AsmA family protein [Alphaproteobacteria bacterium]